MRSILLGSTLVLAGHVLAQVDSKTACDAVTKICYSTYLAPESGISIGIALPMNVSDPYDAIISITAQLATTWAGFAWGGTMVFNPLTVGWANGNTAVVSSRFAFGLGLPQSYDGAEYTLLKGTTANSTHWTMTAKCSGCTSYQANDGSQAVLDGMGTAQFAWAQGTTPVQEPANNNSAFNMHTSYGKWTHDLNAARSPNFDAWVASNIQSPAAPSTTSQTSSVPVTTSKPPTTIVTSTTSSAKPSPTVVKGKIPASCSGAGAPKFSSVLASGWKATKVLGGLTSPRSIIFDMAGNMLVVQSGKGITLHTMTADGCISATKTLIALNSLNHGITLSADGKTLYASSMTQVYSWPYTASSGTVGTRATIITGMFSGGHSTRTLLLSPKNPNLLAVSHGSNDNFDYPSGNPKTARACVKVFDLNAIPSGGYNYVSGGWLAGYGMRNEVGIAFDGNSMLWGVENSGDNFNRGGKDVHQENPAEKLNYIGDVTKNNDKWFGYPTCYAVWKPSDFTDQKFQIGDQFVIAPNATFKDETCKTLSTPPSLVFQPHSAPIDSKFDDTFSNLYVTFHGSWNRVPTTGFKVVQVAFTKGADGVYKPVSPLSTTTGYKDIFWNPDVTKCQGNGPSFSSGCFRPAGLGFDSAGRLYMTSDISSDGELWVLGQS
ncbi:iron reductase domain protein [Cadophora sp. DSE1049]|nr:iron reductase domain protein [Cadophora sp. DSE1049]